MRGDITLAMSSPIGCWRLHVAWDNALHRLFSMAGLGYQGYQGVVSLTLRELSKIISQNYTMPEITIWWVFQTETLYVALGTRTKFQLKILIRNTIFAIHKFPENILQLIIISKENPRSKLWWASNTDFMVDQHSYPSGDGGFPINPTNG